MLAARAGRRPRPGGFTWWSRVHRPGPRAALRSPRPCLNPRTRRGWHDPCQRHALEEFRDRVPPSHGRRSKRRSPSTIPPHTPWTPKSDAWRREYSRHSARTGHATQTAIASAASSRATYRVPGHGKPPVGIDARTNAPAIPVHQAGEVTVAQLTRLIPHRVRPRGGEHRLHLLPLTRGRLRPSLARRALSASPVRMAPRFDDGTLTVHVAATYYCKPLCGSAGPRPSGTAAAGDADGRRHAQQGQHDRAAEHGAEITDVVGGDTDADDRDGQA